MDINDLSAKTRTKDIAHSRQIAMFLTREMTNLSLPKIGENFGGRDHTTVMHACDKIKEEIFSNTNFKYTLEQIKKAITENG